MVVCFVRVILCLQRSNRVMWLYFCGVVLEISNNILFLSLEDLSLNGTPSQSSDFHWTTKGVHLTADLAISGTPNDEFVNVACSVTLAGIERVAWWMFTFPVNTVFITNVKINYRHNCKSSYLFGFPNCPVRFNIIHCFAIYRTTGLHYYFGKRIRKINVLIINC